MAIAEMSKLSLVVMHYDRDNVLNALQQTCAAELREHALTENANTSDYDAEGLREYLSAAERALDYLTAGVNEYRTDNKIKGEKLSGGTVLSYSEFLAQGQKKEQADAIIEKINGFESQKKKLQASLASVRRTKALAFPYSCVKAPFSYYAGSAHTEARIGTLTNSAHEELAALSGEELFAIEKLGEGEGLTVAVAVFHKSCEGERLLQAAGFSSCPFKEGSGEEIYRSAVEEEEALISLLKQNARDVYEAAEDILPLRIYCDYLAYEEEKARLSQGLLTTQTTVFMEGYVPKDKEGEVAAAIDGATEAAYYEFTKPADDEMPPTLYKNNEVVKNFETITDMYSPPSSREFDPNTVMAFFYSLFLGFIMGDIGYGMMMLFGGGAIYLKTRKNPGGLTKLAGVFAVGGVFAIIWGILFNSFFGVGLSFFKAILPDAQNDSWSFMGINVPAVLVISLVLGIVQLFAGYVCKAYQCFRRGEIADGIFEGITWALFSLGVGLAIVGLTEQANCKKLALVGGIIAGGSLVLAIVTAGRKEKILGKFTKGFGTAYGVINYASDILSYARLYGLMLSGAVIAKIVSGYAVAGYNGTTGFMLSGNPLLIILGLVILLLGHVFNFAIGLLGAYIHDARLQYVEFYGRFFEGEGELFRPIGSTHKYVRLSRN